MRQTYRSMAGMCNLKKVFTVAMILLTAKVLESVGEVLQVLMLIGCLLFPVIQPAAILCETRRQAAAVPQDVRLTFDEKGCSLQPGERDSICRGTGCGFTKQPGMVLVLSEPEAGYMLTNRVLGADPEAFWLRCTEQKVEQNR